jgi:hypothetical protein
MASAFGLALVHVAASWLGDVVIIVIAAIRLSRGRH